MHTSVEVHQCSQNLAGGLRNLGGVRGTFAGFVEPFERLVDPVRRTLCGDSVNPGVELPLANLLWVRQTLSYPRGRTHREVYTYSSPPFTVTG